MLPIEDGVKGCICKTKKCQVILFDKLGIGANLLYTHNNNQSFVNANILNRMLIIMEKLISSSYVTESTDTKSGD